MIATAILSILLFFAGQYFVTRKNRMGFLIWTVSNLMIAGVNLAHHQFATAALFLIYGLANVCSLIAWGKGIRLGRIRCRLAHINRALIKAP